jgi:starch-binding outer membrane protein, SusD/RagB family
MKLIQNSIFIVLIALLFNSCEGLEIEPEGDISLNQLFQKPQDAENALLGVYVTLQDQYYYGGYYVLAADALGGDAKTGGYNNSALKELSETAVTPQNNITEHIWSCNYKTITSTNYLIEGISKIKDPAFIFQRKNVIEGQARAIRAMAHFDCLRYFGEHWDTLSNYGIPIMDRIKPFTEVTPRQSVKSNYDFIISELEASIKLMSPNDKKVQYMTQLGAKALLARVNLYKKDFERAEYYATQVIESKQYKLISKENYPSVFSTRQSTESIFELSFSKENKSAFNELTFFSLGASRTDINFLSAESLKAFWKEREGDVRSLLLTYDTQINNESLLPDGRALKYRGEVNQDNPSYIIRFSEMYLIRAEASVPKKGMEDLNYLRATRGLPKISTVFGISLIDFEKTLVNERRAEFFFEGHRYFDLARWGKINTVLNISDFRACLPIPEREIKVSKNILFQNPGY